MWLNVAIVVVICLSSIDTIGTVLVVGDVGIHFFVVVGGGGGDVDGVVLGVFGTVLGVGGGGGVVDGVVSVVVVIIVVKCCHCCGNLPQLYTH